MNSCWQIFGGKSNLSQFSLLIDTKPFRSYSIRTNLGLRSDASSLAYTKPSLHLCFLHRARKKKDSFFCSFCLNMGPCRLGNSYDWRVCRTMNWQYMQRLDCHSISYRHKFLILLSIWIFEFFIILQFQHSFPFLCHWPWK